jgi:hypothetical protein
MMFRPAASLLLVSTCAFLLNGCSHPTSAPQVRVEQPIATPSPQIRRAEVMPTPFPKLPPPAGSKVQQAMHRVFGDAFEFDHPNRQNFIVGDFNGDGSEDLAVIARPAAGKLADVNSEVANWVIQDADKAVITSPKQTVVKMTKEEPPKLGVGETILAIIHGYGPRGWRNPEARQAYVVKHAAATFEGTASSVSQKAIRAMHLPVETEIIKEVRGNKKGFVFWTGGLYAWHPSES